MSTAPPSQKYEAPPGGEMLRVIAVPGPPLAPCTTLIWPASVKARSLMLSLLTSPMAATGPTVP